MDCELCVVWSIALMLAILLPGHIISFKSILFYPHQDCWNHVNGQKAFLPKLRRLLQNGCYGNASVVGPNMLPLFSKIPDDLCGNRQKLLKDLFENLKQGYVHVLVLTPADLCVLDCQRYDIILVKMLMCLLVSLSAHQIKIRFTF